MITIHKTPNQISPAYSYDGIVFEVGSNVSAEGLKIRATLWAKNTFYGDMKQIGVKRQEKFNNRFRFDFSGMLQGLLDHDLTEGGSPFLTPNTPGSSVKFFVNFKEEYIDSTTGLYVTGASINSPNRFAVNSCVDAGEDFEQFICGNSSTTVGRFLTDQPRKIWVREGEVEQLHFCVTDYARVIANRLDAEGEGDAEVSITVGFNGWNTAKLHGTESWGREGWKFNGIGLYLSDPVFGGLHPSINALKFHTNSEKQDLNGNSVLDSIETEYLMDVQSFSFIAQRVKAHSNTGVPDHPNPGDSRSVVDPTFKLQGWDGETLNANGNPDYVDIETFNLTDSIATYTAANAPAAFSGYVRFRLISSIGMGSNVALFQIDITGTPFDPATFAHKRGILHVGNVFPQGSSEETVEVWLEDTNGTRISEIITYCKDHRCKPEHSVRFKWLNRRGGFDAKTFSAVRTEQRKQKRTEIEVALPYNYSSQDRIKKVVSVSADREHSVICEIETEEQSKWMTEIFDSIEVYLVDDLTGAVTPIVITNKAPDDVDTEELPQVEVRFVYANPPILQNG